MVMHMKPGRPCTIEQNQKRWTGLIINTLTVNIPKTNLRLNANDIHPVSNPHLKLLQHHVQATNTKRVSTFVLLSVFV